MSNKGECMKSRRKLALSAFKRMLRDKEMIRKYHKGEISLDELKSKGIIFAKPI